MSTKAAHTPTPWRYNKREYGQDLGFFIQTVDMSHKNTFIGEVGGGLQSNMEITANADLIVTAVNHHQELITRLYNLVNAVETTMSLLNCSAEVNMATHEARETLKKLIQ